MLGVSYITDLNALIRFEGCSWDLKPPVSSSDLCGVVGEVAKAQGGVAWMFESAVDRLVGPLLVQGRSK
jgi:hypothetical protein